MNKTKADPLSRKKIRKLSNVIKNILSLDLKSKIDIIRVFEDLSILFNFQYEIVQDSEMKTNYGETDLSNNLIRIRESVYIGASNGNPRDRFTIAHELGHFCLHKDSIKFCRNEEAIKAYEDPEWQANTFAGEFLVDTENIKELSIDEIMKTYNVSRIVAEIQKKSSKWKIGRDVYVENN